LALPAGASPALTLAATSLGFALVQLDVMVVNVALKTIGSSFGGGIAGLQWVVNAYTVVFASLILTSGALGDRFGAKRLFIVGFILFVAASMGCGAAPNLIILIIARAVQGSGLRCWCRVRSLCSITPIKTRPHALKPSAYGPALLAWRSPAGPSSAEC
jgi:MFS family permease